MRKFIKIPLTEEMKSEYKECARMLDEEGVEKDCSRCSLNGGNFKCLGEFQWCKESPENTDLAEVEDGKI